MRANAVGVERICGDGLCLKLPSNERTLEVVGDGCSIVLSGNSGTVRVIGDGCRLRIDSNVGEVQYMGDGGRVTLGPKCSRSKVKYVGDGGKVSVDGDKKTRVKRPEKMAKKEGESSKDKARCGEEEEDNAANAKKEARSAGRKRKEKVVKIVTVVHYEQDVAGRWFVDPGSVVRSCNGVFAKVETKRKDKGK